MDTGSWDYEDKGASWPQECKVAGQSPVDLSVAPVTQASGTTLFYRYPAYSKTFPILNEGQLLTAFLGDLGGEFAIGEAYPGSLTDRYLLEQIVVHTPSEHTFDGKFVPLEVQLYHRKVPGAEVAVVSVGFRPGGSGSGDLLKALQRGGLPTHSGDRAYANAEGPSLALAELFQGSRGFLQYDGSLTTPPCSGNVRWFVRMDALTAEDTVLDHFRAAINIDSSVHTKDSGNSRELQPLDGRSAVVLSTVADVVSQPAPEKPVVPLGLKAEVEEKKQATKAKASNSQAQSSDEKLAEAKQALTDAQFRQTQECAKASKAKAKLKKAAAGTDQLQAEEAETTASSSCDGATQQVNSLKDQVKKLKEASAKAF